MTTFYTECDLNQPIKLQPFALLTPTSTMLH